MPNIKNLEMAAAISATGCIAIRKSLFGLLQYAVYEPTQSKVKCIIQDYSLSSVPCSCFDSQISYIRQLPTC